LRLSLLGWPVSRPPEMFYYQSRQSQTIGVNRNFCVNLPRAKQVDPPR